MTDFAQDFSSFESKVHQLQGKVQLQTTLDKLEDTQSTVQQLGTRLQKIRERGYVFLRTLETETQNLSQQWRTLLPNLRTHTHQQTQLLQPQLQVLEARLAQLSAQKTSARPPQMLLDSSKALLETLEKKVESAEKTVNGMYDQFQQQVQALSYRLSQIEWMQTQLGEASFSLLAEESPIAAVKAVWCAESKEKPEDPDGVLYLTDQRLIFEQKEDIATHKVLFITTAKKRVQELEWALPLQLLQRVQPRKHGMLKNEDFLDLQFSPEAQHSLVYLHIWQPAEQWQTLLNQTKSGEIHSTRTQSAPPPPARQLPPECPRCGANLSQTLLRGQQSVKCTYCGNEVRAI